MGKENTGRRRFLVVAGGLAAAGGLALAKTYLQQSLQIADLKSSNLALMQTQIGLQVAHIEDRETATEYAQAAQTQQALTAAEMAEKARRFDLITVSNRRLAKDFRDLSVQSTENAAKATQVAWDLLAERVDATAEYYSRHPEDLESILRSMPRPVVQNTVELVTLQKGASEAGIAYIGVVGATGNLVEYDKKTKTGLLITAGHIFDSPDRLDAIALYQNQVDDYWGAFGLYPQAVFRHPEKDLALVKIDFSDTKFPQSGGFPPGALASVSVKGDWKPRVGENLFSLSYPRGTGRYSGFTPAIFEMSSQFQADMVVGGDLVVNQGSSGGGVYNTEGKMVGIIVSGTPSGTDILRIGEAYNDLRRQASL